MELTDDVIAFLSEGTRTGKLGYVAADGRPLAESLRAAAAAASVGRDATIPLVARKGRASYLGDRSAEHLDPGAASAAISSPAR